MRRRFGLFLIFGAALPLVVASAAWACGVLATLKVDKRVAAPGETITATGKNYGNGTGSTAGASDITIRLRSRSGQVLKTLPPAGSINTTFTLPSDLSPGWYTILATQNLANGTPKSGTPGRTTLRIQGAARGDNGAAVAPWNSSRPAGPAASAAPVAAEGGSGPALPLVLAIVLSLTMLTAGWVFVGRRNGATNRAQLGV